ncbi:MAG: hypothetical protein GY711_04055 [bacterium]|nr:hypothetical protein [bacterium]
MERPAIFVIGELRAIRAPAALARAQWAPESGTTMYALCVPAPSCVGVRSNSIAAGASS